MQYYLKPDPSGRTRGIPTATGRTSPPRGQTAGSNANPISSWDRWKRQQEMQMAPLQLKQTQLGLDRGTSEFREYEAGAGQRAAERGLGTARAGLGTAQAQIGLAAIGDVGQAGQRAYTFGREQDEFNRLKMASEARRAQSQMAFQPQMDALRGGIMGRMAGRLGVNLPQMGPSYQSGTGYTPSWMQSTNSPQFPQSFTASQTQPLRLPSLNSPSRTI